MAIRPLLLGHRGARAEKSIPENTVASFDRALAQGCDGFEFDVRLSGDGQPVICHDATVHDLEIAHCPAQQLALPLLGEVLKRYSTAAFLDIELKVCGLEAITMELLCAHPPARGCVISSFLPEVLQTLHGMDASVPLGLVCETRDQFASWPRLPIEYVIPHHNLVTQSVVTESKTKGKKILVWTVNSAKNMRRFAEWEVDGVISDDPEKLVRTLGRKSETNRNK